MRAAGEGGGIGGRATVVAGGGVAGAGDAVEREIGGQLPGMLAVRSTAGEDLRGGLGRPSDGGGFANLESQTAGEVSAGIGRLRRGVGRESLEAGAGEGRAAPFLQLFVEALADDAPIAEIFGDAPEELKLAVAEAVDIAGGGGEKILGGGARFVGEDEEELSAAARSEQDARESEFGQQRAREGFAEERDPLRAAGEDVGSVFVGAGGREEELFDSLDFSL